MHLIDTILGTIYTYLHIWCFSNTAAGQNKWDVAHYLTATPNYTPALRGIISSTSPLQLWLMRGSGTTDEAHGTTALTAYIVWRLLGDWAGEGQGI